MRIDAAPVGPLAPSGPVGYRATRGPAAAATEPIATDAAAELSKARAAADGIEVYQPNYLTARPGGTLGPIDFHAEYEERLGAVTARLTKLFADGEISASPPIRLQTASDGRVIVAGEHPQKEQIEKLFADDPSLRNDFVGAQAQAEFVRAAEEAIAFQKAYREDPERALEEFKHLFQPRNEVFTLTVGDGGASPNFEPAG